MFNSHPAFTHPGTNVCACSASLILNPVGQLLIKCFMVSVVPHLGSRSAMSLKE